MHLAGIRGRAPHTYRGPDRTCASLTGRLIHWVCPLCPPMFLTPPSARPLPHIPLLLRLLLIHPSITSSQWTPSQTRPHAAVAVMGTFYVCALFILPGLEVVLLPSAVPYVDDKRYSTCMSSYPAC